MRAQIHGVGESFLISWRIRMFAANFLCLSLLKFNFIRLPFDVHFYVLDDFFFERISYFLFFVKISCGRDEKSVNIGIERF